ncbi:hypothetical protein ACLM45_13770 [Synechococcus sp. A10-1-5-9]|uniref:hypothetical protein n=1 Tax=Synechococcus sp. A10-1-5-9 TaxID=3392295 RepID=UPI0039E74C0E
MVRPRWQGVQPSAAKRFWLGWDRVVATIAAINLAWVIFDVTYVPLRNFWLQRTLFPLPSINLAIPLPWLPDITPAYDRVKGIEPHRDTQGYINHFRRLETTAATKGIDNPEVQQLRLEMVVRNSQLIDENPFVSSGKAGTLEKLKSRLRSRAGMDSAKQAAAHLLGNDHLSEQNWEEERRFWNKSILPLAGSNYWRGTDENGQAIDRSWQIDTPFQILFLLDILIRSFRLKRRYPVITWRDALLRRWIDLPLLIPFWRLLRIIPVTERLSSARLLQLEPLRAVISRGVVAVLALELFEVITLRILDTAQDVVKSPRLPEKIRRLCTHQSVIDEGEPELAELLRLWLPLILIQVGPALRPQLVAFIGHILRRNLEETAIPGALRTLPGVDNAGQKLSQTLSAGLVDSLLNLSRNAGDRLGQKDPVLESLGVETADRFWEELAHKLETGAVLERSQELIAVFLEDLKRSSMSQLRLQKDVDELITELDGLNFSSERLPPKPQA